MSIDNANPAEWDSLRKTVEKPDHYNKGAVEAIEAIKASMPDHQTHPVSYTHLTLPTICSV